MFVFRFLKFIDDFCWIVNIFSFIIDCHWSKLVISLNFLSFFFLVIFFFYFVIKLICFSLCLIVIKFTVVKFTIFIDQSFTKLVIKLIFFQLVLFFLLKYMKSAKCMISFTDQHNVYSSIMDIKSFTYKKLVLGYGPNKASTVSIFFCIQLKVNWRNEKFNDLNWLAKKAFLISF